MSAGQIVMWAVLGPFAALGIAVCIAGFVVDLKEFRAFMSAQDRKEGKR
ncbi:hypothetical protein [Amycolatopsis speibonae]|uniref:Uncharacterized protein n=1 Tax=Amycolatopsis speibonae TaxID=1450224 RepID=A0ABV7P6L4_9PSEU